MTSKETIELIVKLYLDGIPAAQISKQLKITEATVSKYLKKNNIEIKYKTNKSDYLKGQKFNKILVIEKTNKICPDRCYEWMCKCDCGEIIYISSFKIKHGCGMCRKCGRKSSANYLSTGIGELSGSYFGNVLWNAKARKLNFDITKEFAYDLFVKQNGKCAMTGLDISLGGLPGERVEQTASLDRKDCKFGYTEDNVQWIHKDINIMKNDFTYDEFIKYCELVYKKNEELNSVSVSRQVS